MEVLLYFAVWAALAYLMLRTGCAAGASGEGSGKGQRNHGHGSGSPQLRWVPPETDVDPVCGETVRPATAKPSVVDGMVFYFCSRECRERFEIAPQTYLSSRQESEPKGILVDG